MALIDLINTIKNETAIGANTADRVGQTLLALEEAKGTVFQDIAELRQYIPRAHGEVVVVKEHTAGSGHGGGVFRWDTGYIGISAGSYSLGTYPRYLTMEAPGLTEPLAKEVGLIGDKIEFEGGGTYIPKEGNNLTGTRIHLKGTTSFSGLQNDAPIAAGERAYWPDDNGVVIKPNYTGYNGQGRWKRHLDENNGNLVTPLMYGAIPTLSNLDATDKPDCTAALQACLSSRYNVYVPGGFYYISSGLILDRAKEIILARGKSAADTGAQRRKIRLWGFDQAIIWTDQNINMVTTYVGAFIWSGGVLDASKVPAHTKAAWRYDASFAIGGGTLETKVIGNKDTLMDTVDGGTKAIWVDVENAEQPSESADNYYAFYKAGLGYVSGQKIKVSANGVHSIFWYDAWNAQPDVWGNGFTVDAGGDYYKWGIYAPSCGTSYFSGSLQERGHLSAAFEDEAAIIVGGQSTVVDMFVWDMGMSGEESFATNTGRHQTAIELFSAVELGMRSDYMYKLNKVRNAHIAASRSTLNNPSAYFPSPTRSKGDDGFISRFTNHFGSLINKCPYTITAFKAPISTYFDDYKEESQVGINGILAADNVSITNPDRVAAYASTPTSWVFNAGSDLDLDFVELTILPGSGANASLLRYNMLYMTLDRRVKRIQVIKIKDGISKTQEITRLATDVVHPAYNVRFSDRYDNTTYDKFVIRFIGAYDSNRIRLADFAGKHENVIPEVPYMTIEGGQRIYGTLEVNTPILRSPDGNRWTIDNTGAIVPYV